MAGFQPKEFQAMFSAFHDYGYGMAKVPKGILAMFSKECNRLRDDSTMAVDANTMLAGQINKQYDLTYLLEVEDIRYFLESLGRIYMSSFNVPMRPPNIKGEGWELKVEDLWINIQERGEYNPIHSHNGVLSFALWLEIPYDIKDEQALPNSNKSYKPANGDFYFHPIKNTGEIENVPMNVGRDKEGHICIFPSRMHHSVNPYFSTEKQRVSISGNLYFKKKGND